MKPIVLCILDGVGINKNIKGNAYLLANKPCLDNLFKKYPHSKLNASESYVGLPKGQMGNSEVGHSTIGSGRIISQSIERINKSIKSKELEKNKKLLEMFSHIKKNNSHLHLIGLVSDGGVHSKMNHIQALIDICSTNDIPTYLHIITDGRDTLKDSSLSYIESLDLKKVKIASVSGRYYAMDRDNRYDRIESYYDVITGSSTSKYENIKQAIKINYENNITDEFILPGLIDIEGILKDDDGIILFNFRPDRLREIGNTLKKDFKEFKRKKKVNVKLLTMMKVNGLESESIFDIETINNTLGEYLSKLNYKQLRIAETEKYAHVTYFFDGGKTLNLKNCDKILIPSPHVATYDLKPSMSAYEITDKLLNIIDNYDIIILNYANGDMVGHTGNLDSAIKAVEVLDECVKKLYEKIISLDGTLIITADHGNCEEMIDSNNNILTSHTTNKVNFLITKDVKLKDGKLSDIAPTILELLNEKIPKEMTGESLIENR